PPTRGRRRGRVGQWSRRAPERRNWPRPRPGRWARATASRPPAARRRPPPHRPPRCRVGPKQRAHPSGPYAGPRARPPPERRTSSDPRPTRRCVAQRRARDPADDRTAWISPSSLLLPIREQDAQGPPRVEHLRPNGAFGNAKDLSDFRVCVTLYIEQDDGHAAPFRKLGQGL